MIRSVALSGSRWKYRHDLGGVAGQLEDSGYIAVNAPLVAYGGGVSFDVFMKKGSQYFLFAKGGNIGDAIRERCIANGVDTLYICREDKEAYDIQADMAFPELIQDQSLPSRERGKMLHAYSLDVAMDVFKPDGLLQLDAKHRERLERLMDGAYAYLTKTKGALSGLGMLLRHNSKTYNHCVNVSLYVVSLLVRLGYDRATCRHVGAGATLHDIGKLKVPRAILDKPGRLSEEERRVINTHPDEGLRLCRSMDLDPVSRDCVIFHHEKLDGSGYPAGAKGIPEYVRMVTMADIFDALTSDRPYSKPFSAFEAMKILKKEIEAGKLDAGIGKEFIAMLSHDGLTV